MTDKGQLCDQMVGLLRADQKYMLGLILKPHFITFRIFNNNRHNTLRVHTFDDLLLDDENTVASIETLCNLIIAFIFIVDC